MQTSVFTWSQMASLRKPKSQSKTVSNSSYKVSSWEMLKSIYVQTSILKSFLDPLVLKVLNPFGERGIDALDNSSVQNLKFYFTSRQEMEEKAIQADYRNSEF